MAFIVSKETKVLIKSVEEFCKQKLKPVIEEYDTSGEFLMGVYKAAMEMGLHCLEIPEEFGGLGLDNLSAAVILSKVSEYDAGFATGLNANSLALKSVLIAGTPAQKQMFADIVVPGNFAAFGLTEPNAGSDVSAISTTAEFENDHYIINGRKTFIINGGVADVLVVFASINKSKGLKGLSAFIVEKKRLGISIGKEENKMGIRLSNTTDVVFDNVVVPKENLLGKEGEGFIIAMKTLDLARPFVGAIACGIAERCIRECVGYMKERVQFGRPLAELDVLRNKLADMEIKKEAAIAMVEHVFRMIDMGVSYTKEAAVAKAFAGDTAVEVVTEAIQIHGGYGYSREYPVEKLLRDARIFQIFEGTNEIQKVVIADDLLNSA